MGSPLASKLVTPLQRGHKHARGLVYCLRFNEGLNPPRDEIAGLVSTISNTPTWSVRDRGLALEFARASSEELDTNFQPPLVAEPRTIIAWCRPTAITTPVIRYVLGYGGNGNGRAFQLSAESSVTPRWFFRHGGGAISYLPGVEVTITNMVALVVPIGATTTDDVLLYSNAVIGIPTREAGSDRTLNTAASDMSLGNSAAFDNFYDGHIDEFRIYDRALSHAEILEIYLDPNALYRVQPPPVFFAGVAAGALLAGDLAYSLTSTGDLQRGISLSGDLNYLLTHAGTIQIGQFLSGALAYSLTHTGDIEIGKFLAGDLVYSLAHTGDISIGKFLAGNLSYSLNEVGDIQVGKLLAGALTYSLTEAGTIQVGKFLAGALSYSLTHSGTLTVGGIELAGDLAYSLTHGGTIEIGKFLAGALSYSLIHTGDLQIGKFLTGALVYSLTHEGTLAVGALLAGDLDYSLTELGDIQVGQFLAGALAYSLTEVGTIQIGKFLEGALSYSLTEAGTITLDILLSGALNYSLSHTGNLQIGQFLNGNLSYSLTETGDIQIGINLVGQETITLTLSGTLTVAAVVFRVLLRINEALQTPNMINEELSVTERVGETLIS